jgi:hypothetical protein
LRERAEERKMRYEYDKFLYRDEDDREQYIMFIHPITRIETIGKLGNECMVYTEHAEYHVQWLKDRERTRVVALKGPENRWDI